MDECVIDNFFDFKPFRFLSSLNIIFDFIHFIVVAFSLFCKSNIDR